MKPQSCFPHGLPKTGANLGTPWGRYRHGCDPPAARRNALNPLATLWFVSIAVFLNLGVLSSAALPATAAEEPGTTAWANDRLIPLMVHLEQSLYFDAPDGQIVAVPPGAYLVEPVTQGEPRLVFWHEHGTVTLQADRTSHHQRVETPEAYLIREDDNEDIHHVVVFLSEGTALEATGSGSGIQIRGNFRSTRHYELDRATGVVQFGDGRHGRRPPTGQLNSSALYGKGVYNQDNESTMSQLQAARAYRQTVLTLGKNLLNSLHGRFQLEENTDRPGKDYARHMDVSPESCRTRCAGDSNCQAFTFVKPSPGSAQGQCFLKPSEPMPVANHCCVSGTRSTTQEKIIRNIK